MDKDKVTLNKTKSMGQK